MNPHSETAPFQTSFVLSTQIPCPPSGNRGSMSPLPRQSSLPPRPPTSKQIESQNFNHRPRLSQPVFTFGSLPPMSPAPSGLPMAYHNGAIMPPFAFTRTPTSSSDNYSAGLHSMLPQDAMQMIYTQPMEMPVGPGGKEPHCHGEPSSFMDEYVTAYMELNKNDFYNRGDDVERLSTRDSGKRRYSKKGGFTESQMKKIANSEKLRKLFVTDPQYVKRILSSRESARRTQEKKEEHILEMKKTIPILEKEVARVTALTISVQRTKLGLEEENKQIRIRLQALEEQAKLAKELKEYYDGEINRLKQKETEVSIPNSETLMFENMLMEQLSLDEEPETNNYGFE